MMTARHSETAGDIEASNDQQRYRYNMNPSLVPMQLMEVMELKSSVD